MSMQSCPHFLNNIYYMVDKYKQEAARFNDSCAVNVEANKARVNLPVFVNLSQDSQLKAVTLLASPGSRKQTTAVQAIRINSPPIQV